MMLTENKLHVSIVTNDMQLFVEKEKKMTAARHISINEALKMFEGDVIEAMPTDRKRIVIPAFGFAGATPHKRLEWGADGTSFMEDVKGLAFLNPKDAAVGQTTPNQILKQKDGVLLCYDAPGRKEQIEGYIAANPNTFDNAVRLKHFINYLTNDVLSKGGEKPDLWDSDTAFAAGLRDAPAKEDIKPGMVFSSVKKKEVVQAIRVPEGVTFTGTDGQIKDAKKGGAYIIKDSAGMRLIQSDEFPKTYQVIKMPKMMTKEHVKE